MWRLEHENDEENPGLLAALAASVEDAAQAQRAQNMEAIGADDETLKLQEVLLAQARGGALGGRRFPASARCMLQD